MFHHVGKKIKVFAKVVAWIGIIAWSLIGLLMLLGSSEVIHYLRELGLLSSTPSTPLALLITAVLTAGFGSFSSYLSSLFIYGFGQLIDNSDRLVEEDDEEYEAPAPVKASARDASPKTLKKWLKSGLITKKEYQEMLRK